MCLLTQPHVLQADYKTSSQIEDCEQSVAHEGGGLQGGQRGSHKQSHGSAAVHHQPHQHEVEQETVWSLVQPCQPIDGQTIDQGEDTVLWQLSKHLRKEKASI